jgi:serine/threonine protein kinase/WD40 repeat protein
MDTSGNHSKESSWHENPSEPTSSGRHRGLDSLRIARQLDLACREFEQAFRRQQAKIEQFLIERADLPRGELLSELIATEFSVRVESGEEVSRAEYFIRFPDETDCVNAAMEFIDWSETDAKTEATTTLKPGVRFAEFEIVRELDRGGMGVIYEALQWSLGRRVALKVMHRAIALDARQVRRFELEACALAALPHPHIVGIYAVGIEQGVHWMAMTLIEGRSLARLRSNTVLQPDDPAIFTTLLDRNRSDRFRAIAQLGRDVANALDYAHRHAILHRDIKPSNVLIDRYGIAHLSDFGLAQLHEQQQSLTATGEFLGTLSYAAPETLHAASDARSDIYSLGATLYELVGLQPIFEVSEHRKLVDRVSRGIPTPWAPAIQRAVPRDLRTVIEKAMAVDPKDRYVTAAELKEDLQRFLDHKPILARPTGMHEQVVRFCRREPWLSALAGLLLLSLIVGFAITLYRGKQLQLANNQLRDQLQREIRLLRITEQAEQEAVKAQREAEESAAESARAAQIANQRAVELHNRNSLQAMQTGDFDDALAATEAALRIAAKTGSEDATSPAGLLSLQEALQHRAQAVSQTLLQLHSYGSLPASSWSEFRDETILREPNVLIPYYRQSQNEFELTTLYRTDWFERRHQQPWSPRLPQFTTRIAQERAAAKNKPTMGRDAVTLNPPADALVTVHESLQAPATELDASRGSSNPVPMFATVDRPLSVRFVEDGKHALVQFHDGRLEYWDAESNQYLHPLTLPTPTKRGSLPLNLLLYVAQSSDDRWLLGVFGKQDNLSGRCVLWDLMTGCLVSDFEESLSLEFHEAKFICHDRFLVIRATRTIAWDLQTRRPLISQDADLWRIAAVSQDGRWMAAISGHTVQIWNLLQIAENLDQVPQPTYKFFLPQGTLPTCLELNSDGSKCWVGTMEGTVLGWDLANLTKYVMPLYHGGVELRDLKLDPTNQFLAGISRRGKLRIWNIKTGIPKTPLFETGLLSGGLAWDDSADRLAISKDTGELLIWHAYSDQHTLLEENASFLSPFSPDSNRLVTINQQGKLTLWDVSQSPCRPLQQRIDPEVVETYWLAASDNLLLLNQTKGLEMRTVNCWNWKTNSVTATGIESFCLESPSVAQLAADQSGLLLVDLNRIEFLSAQEARPLWKKDLIERKINIVTGMSAQGDRIGVIMRFSDNPKATDLWVIDTHGRFLVQTDIPQRYGTRIIQLVNQGKQVVAGGQFGLRVWSCDTGEQQRLDDPQLALPVLWISYSAPHDLLAICTENGECRVLNTKTWQTVGAAFFTDRQVQYLTLLPDGKRILLIDRQGKLQFWDWYRGEPLGPSEYLGTIRPRIYVSPDGKHLVWDEWNVGIKIREIPPLFQPESISTAK